MNVWKFYLSRLWKNFFHLSYFIGQFSWLKKFPSQSSLKKFHSLSSSQFDKRSQKWRLQIYSKTLKNRFRSHRLRVRCQPTASRRRSCKSWWKPRTITTATTTLTTFHRNPERKKKMKTTMTVAGWCSSHEQPPGRLEDDRSHEVDQNPASWRKSKRMSRMLILQPACKGRKRAAQNPVGARLQRSAHQAHREKLLVQSLDAAQLPALARSLRTVVVAASETTHCIASLWASESSMTCQTENIYFWLNYLEKNPVNKIYFVSWKSGITWHYF